MRANSRSHHWRGRTSTTWPAVTTHSPGPASSRSSSLRGDAESDGQRRRRTPRLRAAIAPLPLPPRRSPQKVDAGHRGVPRAPRRFAHRLRVDGRTLTGADASDRIAWHVSGKSSGRFSMWATSIESRSDFKWLVPPRPAWRTRAIRSDRPARRSGAGTARHPATSTRSTRALALVISCRRGTRTPLSGVGSVCGWCRLPLSTTVFRRRAAS